MSALLAMFVFPDADWASHSFSVSPPDGQHWAPYQVQMLFRTAPRLSQKTARRLLWLTVRRFTRGRR